MTAANVRGSLKSKLASKKTDGTVPNEGAEAAGRGLGDRGLVGGSEFILASPAAKPPSESPSSFNSVDRSKCSHSEAVAFRYASKSFRRTRGRRAGTTGGTMAWALGGADFLCGLFTRVEIAEVRCQ